MAGCCLRLSLKTGCWTYLSWGEVEMWSLHLVSSLQTCNNLCVFTRVVKGHMLKSNLGANPKHKINIDNVLFLVLYLPWMFLACCAAKSIPEVLE